MRLMEDRGAICLCFVALKPYKKFERLLRVIEFEMSVDKVLDIAKTLFTITIALPDGGNKRIGIVPACFFPLCTYFVRLMDVL